MPSEQDNTALAAIIIAVIAFFVTTGQLLQQIFGTADGYRHCQASVIGDWATLTRRKWRWSEFRFETKFTTPDIRLIEVAGGGLGNVRFITGDWQSRCRTYTTSISNTDDDDSGDQVGWLALLDQLHSLQYKYKGEATIFRPDSAVNWPLLNMMSCPAITLRERSWDFIPPDIIRPVATSTVGDIIVLAHRLGMGWNDLRLGDGIMQAEGNGNSIASTAVRGFGILLQFNHDQVPQVNLRDHSFNGTIPSASADKLGFGIVESAIRCHGAIGFEGANETEAAKEVMSALGIDEAVIRKYGAYMEHYGNSLGLSDILGMWAPFMTFPGSCNARVMKVHRDVDRGPTCSREGFLVFYLRLEKYEKEGACSEQMLYLLSTYRKLKERWELGWELPMHGGKNRLLPPEFFNEIGELWDEVMDRLRAKYTSGSNIEPERDIEAELYIGFVLQVVTSHITQAVEYPVLAKAALNDTAQRQKIEEGLGSSMDLETAAGMHQYIDRIPLVVSFMKDRGYDDGPAVIDVWWSLIFRAMLWHRGHDIIEGKTRGYGGIPVPPSLWGSKLPVYIA